MAININNLQNNAQVKTDKVEQQTQRQQASVQQNSAQAPNQKQDSVSLTPQAQQLTKLTEKANNSSGIDQEKVDKIKQAISEGKYKINVEQLAKSIVEFENELFSH
ncbi:flagellar biosynthesis anti-sigma factor FlgM [Rheinheimera sp. WS51]|uniref:flagellar biosynthesis anti-sigma factor FlgM n=1 Tax=Rheinheimera sp. WS51 TaxID=3425886 RepID=UPI003D8AE76B